MGRRLVCSLISASGILAIQLAGARSHLHHEVGTLAIEIRDDTGTPIPARLTFRPFGDTPKVFFTTTDIARREVGAAAAFDRAFVLRGDAELRVPAGTYDVWVSHGPEWDTTRERVMIKAGAETELKATLHHVIDTPGWISGDFHVHAAPSLDSRVPLGDRVHQFVADGIDLIVSTDHNVIADYGPVIAELGVGDLLASATGDEITTKDWGHFGAFPLPLDPGELGNGAIVTGNHSATQIFADVRADSPRALIDVHHPRLEHGKIGYFHLSELDITTGKAKHAGFSFDFDAIEILNGYQDADRKTVDRVIADWIAFLDSGKRVAATGNSDTHHLTFNLGGYPRNYVAVGDVPVNKLDPYAVAAAVKAGRCFFTTGPFVEATIDGKTYGDTVKATNHKVTLHVRVRAASWVSTTTVTIIGPAGATLATRTLPDSVATNVIRLDDSFVLDMPRDGYVIVRVDGIHPMAPNVGDIGSFPVYPLALTNPIWVDADGDGKITPLSPYKFVEQAP